MVRIPDRFDELGLGLEPNNLAAAGELETEFVCIPRPIVRSDRPDGGPLVYRVVHRVKTWAGGERPRLTQEVLEGNPPLATK